MIELKNISCGYGKKQVLSSVNLKIEEGKITCLLGQNGAGKTTLFKTIMGLLSPLNGTVFLNKKPLSHYTQKELARFFSYVPQAHNTPFPFTVSEVVLMGQYACSGGLLRLPRKENRKIATDCIHMLGIEKLKDNYFSTLSGGEKQLVLIARAMAQQPVFIAMDEPTSNLDMGNQVRVIKIAGMLKKQGYGIIMNTHAPEQALNFADHVILLKDGKVRKAGNPSQVLDSNMISEIYNTCIELVAAQTRNGDIRQVCISS